MTNKSCLPRIQTSSGKVVGGLESGCLEDTMQRGHHTSKDKLQIKESTMNQEIFEKKTVTTTTLNVLHLTIWPHLCGNDA